MSLRPYRLPLRVPLVTAAGVLSAREGLILDLGGRLGDAAPLPAFGGETLAECRAALEAWIAGSRAPLPPAAAHAVDQAELGPDAARRLNPDHAGAVAVSALVTDAESAGRAVRRGFSCLKVKVGVDPERDLARVAAIRAAAPDAALRLDANGAWDLSTARELLARLAPLRIESVEEPVRGLEAMAALRGDIPIAADESCRSLADVEAAADRVDAVVVKPMLCGGLRPALVMLRAAAELGLHAWVTTSLESAVGRRGALHVAAAAWPLWPCGLDTGGLLARDVASGPVARDGWMRV